MYFASSFVFQRILNFSVIFSLFSSQIGILSQKTGAFTEKSAPVTFPYNIQQETRNLQNPIFHEKTLLTEDVALELDDVLLFIENQGQFDPKILFRARGDNLVIDVTQEEIWVSLLDIKLANPEENGGLPRVLPTPSPGEKRTESREKEAERVNLRIQHSESLNLSKVTGCNPVETPTTNYILGKAPKTWISTNTMYRCILFEEVPPGMDLEISAKNGLLLQRNIYKETTGIFGMKTYGPVYDYSKSKNFMVTGAQEMRDEEEGLLAITQLGQFRFSSTVTYSSDIRGEEQNSLPGSPKVDPAVIPNEHMRFDLLEDDLIFSTFLGGSNYDNIEDIIVNENGEITVTGDTESIDLPESAGYSLYDFNGGYDIFIAQFNPTASDVNFITYIGGEDLDFVNTLVQDSNGNIYISGYTISEDFPTTTNAFDSTFNEGQSAYLVKLSPEADELVYSTFIGTGQGFDLELDQDEDIILLGQTNQDNQMGTITSYDPTHNGEYDGFVTKFDSTNYQMVFYTFLGGIGNDCELAGDFIECSISILENGNIVIAGMTDSQNFPITLTAYQSLKDYGYDLFLSILSSDGTQMVYSTFLGGNDDDVIKRGGLAIDQDGYIVLTGKSSSTDFPTTENAYASFHYEDFGEYDATLSILDFTETEPEDQLIYSSYFGGEGDDNVKNMLITDEQELVIMGNTRSLRFPILDNAFRRDFSDTVEGFFIKLDPNSDYKVNQATFFGGAGIDVIGLAKNSPENPGDIVFAGYTASEDFPLSLIAFDTYIPQGDTDGFLSSFSWPEPLENIDLFKSSLEVSPAEITINENDSAIVTAIIRDSQGNPLPGKEIRIDAEGSGVELSQTSLITDSLGQVSAEISSTIVQSIAISAHLEGTDISIQDEKELLVNFWGISVTNSSISTDPALVLAGGLASSEVIVTLRDNFNLPMPDFDIEIMASGSAQVMQTVTSTDENGQVFATVRDSLVETVTLTPLVNDIPLGKTAAIRFETSDISAVLSGPEKSSPANEDQFTIGVRNISRLDAEDVVLGLTLPEEFTLESQTGPVIPTQSGNYYEWELGTLAVNQRIEFGIVTSLDAQTQLDQELQTQVEVSTITDETNLNNNTRTLNTEIVSPYSFPAQLFPVEQSIGIGDTAEFNLLVRNTGFYPAVFNVSQSGLDTNWVAINPSQTHLQPGQSQTVVISVETQDCQAEGEYPFTVHLDVQGHPELSAEYQAQLNLDASPQVQINSPVQGMTTGSGTVNFSWQTSPATTGVVTYIAASDPEEEYTLTANTSATTQAVQASGLIHNEDYGWSLSVTSTCGSTVIADQSFNVGTGIAFLNHTPVYEIDRDYNQIIEIAVRNDDDEAHTLTATIQNPYTDLITNFVGSGSVDETITLGPGASTMLRLAVHAQDAILSNYQLTSEITADLGSSDPLIDTASINIEVLTAFDVDIQKIATDAVTGVATYQIENVGDKTISDLRLDTRDESSGELADVYIFPDISHANLGAGQSIQFEVIPIFNEEQVGQSGTPTQIDFEMEVSGSNQSEVFNEQVGCSSGAVQAVEIQNSCMVTVKNDWYCTNRPTIDVNFKIPGFVNTENLLSMDLNMLMNPTSNDVREHSSAFSFNGVPIASFSNLIPNGELSTSVPTNAFQGSMIGPSVQQLRLQSNHSNSGHYVVASDFELGFGLSSAHTYVCAESATQANTLVQQVYHLEDLSTSANCTASQVYRSSTYSSSADFCSTSSNTQVTVGNPINTLTGALEYSTSDISFSTLTGELEFRRWYSSLTTDIYTSYLGYGWTHNLDLRLIFPNDPQGEAGIVLLKGPSANQYKFTINPDGTFTAYPGLCGNLIKIGNEYHFTDKNGTIYLFNISGMIIRQLDSEGHARIYSYNGQQQLVRVTDDVSGRFLALDYDLQGRISTVSDQSERSVFYYYDETSGDLSQFDDLGNNTWTYDYFEATTVGHLLSQVTDPSERIIERTEYDEQGRAVRQFDGTDTLILELEYQNGFGLTKVLDANMNPTVFNFGNDNALKSQENALGMTIEKDFDLNFNLSTLTDVSGNVTELEWSENGRNLTQVSDALENLTHFEYTDDNLTKIIDALGNETNLVYQGKLLISSSDEYGNITTYDYTTAMDSPQPVGLLKSITDALGRTTSYFYDENGQLAETSNELGIFTAYAYNELGQMITQYTPDGRANWNCYDDFGRVTRSVENASGDGSSPQSDPCDRENYEENGDPDYDLISERIYDVSGNLIATIDRRGIITRSYYDSANRLVATVQNLQNWDLFNPNLPPPEYRTVIDNLLNQTVYDEAGNVIATIATDGKITRTYYDALQRPEFIVQNLNGQDIFVPTPPPASNRGLDSNVTRQNIYDKRSNLIATLPLTEGCTIQKSSGEYPVITASANCRVTRTYYDALNRSVAVVQNLSGQSISNESIPARNPANKDINLRSDSIYDPTGNLIVSIDQAGRITRTYYDALQRAEYTVENLINWSVETTTPPPPELRTEDENVTTQMVFDVVGNLIANIDPAGTITRTWFDEINRPYLSVANLFDPSQPQASLQDLLALTEVPAYDQGYPDRNVPASEPLYDESGNAIASIDALGHISRTYFDDLQRPLQSVQNLSGQAVEVNEAPEYDEEFPDRNIPGSRSVYDSGGQLIATIDPTGMITRNYFDALGRIWLVVLNLSGQDIVDETPPGFNPQTPEINIRTETVYNQAGQAIASMDTYGRITRTYFDGLNRPLASVQNLSGQDVFTDSLPVFDPQYPDQNILMQTVYDTYGQAIAVIAADGTTQRSYYDKAGRVLVTINNLQGQDIGDETPPVFDPEDEEHIDQNVPTYYFYNVNGNLTDQRDANEIVTHYEYDERGRLTVVVENYRPAVLADNETNLHTEYEYDVNGNRLSILDANALLEERNDKTSFVYDAMGRQTAESDPLGNTWSQIYNILGQRIAGTDANGGTIAYEYDAGGRLITIDYPEPQADVSFSYDIAGRRVGMTDSLGDTVWYYDQLGRVTGVSDANENLVGYEYDALGNRSALTYPDEKRVDYSYDALYRLEKVNDWDEHETTYQYDPNGRLLFAYLPNGIVSSYQYDGIGRLESLTHQEDDLISAAYGYSYDAVGNRSQAQEFLLIPGGSSPFVTVAVKNASLEPLQDIQVRAFNGSSSTEYMGTTNENGEVQLTLPFGNYRFRAMVDGVPFWSGANNHCQVEGCHYAEIIVPEQLEMSVQDNLGNPIGDVTIQVYSEGKDTGLFAVTEPDGSAILMLPLGEYQFRVAYNDTEFFSTDEDYCVLPGCVSAQVSVIEPILLTIVDSQGWLVEGAQVDAFNSETDSGVGSQTDINGEVYLPLQKGDYRFRITYNGHTFWSAESNHCTVPGCNNLEVIIPHPVSVTVLNTNGQVQSGITVSVYQGETERKIEAITDSNGQVQFILPDGEFRFSTEAGEGQAQFWSGENDHCTFPGCTTSKIIVNPHTSVSVLDVDGNPLSGVEVAAYIGEIDTGFRASTAENGHAVFLLPEGEYHFRAEINGEVYKSSEGDQCAIPGCELAGIQETAAQDAQESAYDFNMISGSTGRFLSSIRPSFLLQGTQVTVEVRNGDDEPQAGIWVHAYSGTTFMNYSAQTNSNGQAVLTMNDGSYRFRANVNGVHFWSGESNHCTVPGCSSAEITITDPITVTVMDTDENPKAGINVLAFVGTTYIGVSKTTDTNGQAIFTLHEGSYRFQALVDNIAFWSGETNHCTVPGCETAGITVTNPVTVTVQDTASQPKAGLLVTAFNGSTPIPTGRFTNENGQANLTLPMGSYRFRVNYNGTNFWSGTVNHCTVPGCTSAQITVPGPIPVTVLDSDETPQVGLPVYAFNGETYAGVSGTTDSNGRVLLTLPNGSYRFRTELNSVSFWSGTVNHCTVPGCTGASITVTKPLTVHVEDTQAEPRAGLTVRIYDGGTYTTYSEVTDENGDAQFTLPAGSYRVRVDYNEAIFWSGAANHCTLPGCEQVNVVVNQPVTVSVKGVDGSPFEGTLVELYRGEVLVTNDDMSNAEGEITFTLNDGSYRFAANVSGTRFWSGEVDHCVIPGCTEAVITLPGGQNGVIEHAISYEYDPLYRLTEANYDDGIYFHYQYDAVGNRLSEEKKLEAELPEIVNSYEYDIANRLIEVNSLEYEWDDNGNLLDDGVSLYSYDFNNKLLEITKGTDTFSYAYNGLGDRLSQTVNEVTTDYVLDIQSSLTQVLQNGTNTYLYGVNRVAEFSDTEEEYYLADALGSVRNLTNDSGLVTLGQSFTPYGEVLETYGSAQTDYAYTGEMYDPLTGLVYLRARYYAPGDGRFVSKDVWAGEYTHPLSLNRWSYVAANPVNFIDPTGLWRWYLTEPMYHLPIEDYYESMSGFNPNRQLEYPIPGTPFRHPDMFNSLIGEVYEIEPIYLRSSGSIQVQGYVTDLKKAAVVNLLSGSHLLGGSFDWNQTFFHVGAGIDWPGKFRKSPLNSFFPFVDLVADYVGNGVVAYWLEPNVNAPVIVGKPVEGLVPNRRLLRSRNWTPGAPSYQPAYAVDIGTVCGAVLIAAGGTLLLVTIVEDATVLGVVDDIVTVPGGYFLINYGLKLATFSPVP